MADLKGTAGNDTLTGTASSDDFDIHQGSTDSVDGLEGNDVVRAGGTFDASDRIDGGAGFDTLKLIGDYAAGVVLGDATLLGVERIILAGAFDYRLTTADATVAGFDDLTVDARDVTGSHGVHFDNEAESDGGCIFFGSAGNDTFIGGGGSDIVDISNGGADTVSLGPDGSRRTEAVIAGAALSTDDVIDGGAGWNVLALSGDYSTGLVLSAAMTTNISDLALYGPFTYVLTADATIRGFNVTASSLVGDGHLVFDGSAATMGSFAFHASPQGDVLIGGPRRDFFLPSGGPDVMSGNGGKDVFQLSGSIDANVRIDGGTGVDEVIVSFLDFQKITFNALTMRNVEVLFVQTAQQGIELATDDATVAAGKELEVLTPRFGDGITYRIDGRAETDGRFSFRTGRGDDVLTGGAQADEFIMNFHGHDVLSGAGGDDVFRAAGGLAEYDRLRGGAGDDTIVLGGQVTLGARTIQSIETIEFMPGRDYRLKTDDGNVGAGKRLRLDGRALAAGEELSIDGSAESDGRLTVLGGDGDDRLTGGAGQDQLKGDAGSDILQAGAGDDIVTGGESGDFLYGGAGDDRFMYRTVADSTPDAADWIRDWTAGDVVDLSAIDADAAATGDQAFSYIGASAFDGKAGELQVITTATWNVLIRGDTDGDGIADLLIKASGAPDFSAGSFRL